jgi:hypothetical protein
VADPNSGHKQRDQQDCDEKIFLEFHVRSFLVLTIVFKFIRDPLLSGHLRGVGLWLLPSAAVAGTDLFFLPAARVLTSGLGPTFPAGDALVILLNSVRASSFAFIANEPNSGIALLIGKLA